MEGLKRAGYDTVQRTPIFSDVIRASGWKVIRCGEVHTVWQSDNTQWDTLENVGLPPFDVVLCTCAEDPSIQQ